MLDWTLKLLLLSMIIWITIVAIRMEIEKLISHYYFTKMFKKFRSRNDDET